MKKGQSVVILTFKESGESYIFGSLSAIYAKYSVDDLGVTYSSLRNAVATYIEKYKVDENKDYSQVIYDTKNSPFILRRAPLLLADKKDKKN